MAGFLFYILPLFKKLNPSTRRTLNYKHRIKMMNLTKSSNPVFKERVFSKEYASASEAMTINGTINKTALMLLMVIAGALFTWNKFFDAIAVNPEAGTASV